MFAIGDIHGHLRPLQQLLEALSINAKDQLVFLGDYIDKGPQSYQVLECLIQFKKTHPHTVFLRGNHEQWLLNWLYSRDDTFLYLGGRQTLQSYFREAKRECPDEAPSPREFLDVLPSSHLSFLDHTRLFYEHLSAVFVHGGLNPQRRELKSQSPFDLLMAHRDFFKAREYPKPVVVGHSSTEIFGCTRPVILPSGIIMVDTSCDRTGRLSAVEITSRQFCQVDAKGHVLRGDLATSSQR